MPRYDLGALIAGLMVLPLVMTPSSFAFLRILFIRFLRLIGFHSCDIFCWDNLLGGGTKLHRCPASSSFHAHQQQCCGDGARLIGEQLNSCWLHRHYQASEPPFHLNPLRRYLKTDVRTLFCWLMSAGYPTVESCCNEKACWYNVGGATLSLEGDIATICKVLPTNARSDDREGNGHMVWTKLEVEQIFSGAPPSFREEILLCGGRVFRPDLSLVGRQNRRRGGWVFAAGLLCDNNMAFLSPLYVHNPLVDDDTLLGGCMYARDVVSLRFIPTFRKRAGGDKLLHLLAITASALDDMCAQKSGSSAQAFLYGTDLSGCFTPHTKWAESLSLEECQMCLKFFSEKGPLEQREVDLLRMKMIPILAIIITGVYITFQHLNNSCTRLSAESANLFSQNRYVYLAY